MTGFNGRGIGWVMGEVKRRGKEEGNGRGVGFECPKNHFS